MTFLLDTVTVSEPSRRRPAPRVLEWLDAQSDDRLFLSVMTIGELRFGSERLGGAHRRPALERWISAVIERFDGRVLDVDSAVAQRWGGMLGRLENTGRRPELVDSIIAATALVHDLTVVTRNVADFERCGVPVINPWDG